MVVCYLFVFRKQINLKIVNRDPGSLFMVIGQCIVRTMIRTIVLIMKQLLELAFLYFIGELNIIKMSIILSPITIDLILDNVNLNIIYFMYSFIFYSTFSNQVRVGKSIS